MWEDNAILKLAFMTQRDWNHQAQDGEASRSTWTSGLRGQQEAASDEWLGRQKRPLCGCS